MASPAFKFTVDGREASPLALAFQGRLTEVVDAKLALLKRAYPRAMSVGVGTPGKAKLRATIEASGFYRAGALAKTWRANTYPLGAPTLEPAVQFSTKAGVIVEAFENGVTITVKDAQYLAIPEGPAKAIIHQLNRGRTSAGALHNEANPVERVAQALGVALIPIISKDGDVGVLVADDLSALTKRGKRTKANRGAPTPLFALVKSATLKQRPMGRAVLAQIGASFQADFAAALARQLGGDD